MMVSAEEDRLRVAKKKKVYASSDSGCVPADFPSSRVKAGGQRAAVLLLSLYAMLFLSCYISARCVHPHRASARTLLTHAYTHTHTNVIKRTRNPTPAPLVHSTLSPSPWQDRRHLTPTPILPRKKKRRRRRRTRRAKRSPPARVLGL